MSLNNRFAKEMIERLKFLPDQEPLIISNTDKPNIHDTFYKYLQNPQLDSIYFSCPYVSSYFVNFIKKTPTKMMIMIIDENPPIYTLQSALAFLRMEKENKMHVNVIQRPERSKFLHQKLFVPIYIDPASKQAYSPCAFGGSVNLTKNGLIGNDETLFVIRNYKGILKILQIIYERAITGKSLTIEDINLQIVKLVEKKKVNF